MVETVEERLWREPAVEKGFPARLITISYLLNPEVQASEDVMSKSLLRNTMVLGSETQDPVLLRQPRVRIPMMPKGVEHKLP